MKSTDILLLIVLTAEISLSIGYLLAKWVNFGKFQMGPEIFILPVLIIFWVSILQKNKDYLFRL